MNRLLLLSIVCLLVSIVRPSSAATQASTAPRKPNIIFIVMDDMGPSDVGTYGSTFHETPNIDRLAREGLKFTRAYTACPVCSPTRAALLTGRYPVRSGVTEFRSDGRMQPENWKRNTKMLPAHHTLDLPLSEITIAEMLKPVGYVTASIGKWHLGGKGFLPEDQGFDVNIFGSAAGGAKKFGPWNDLPGTKEGDHIDTVLTDRAIDFITQNRDRPFLLYLPYYEPHTKIESFPALVEKYKKKLASMPPIDPAKKFGDEGPRRVRLVQDDPTYAAIMETVDANIGRLVTHVDSLGIGNDTLIIFTSDNGGLSTSEGSPTSNAPFRAGKGWLYEGGIRTAFIARWTGTIKPGVTDQIVSSPDFALTFLELTGAPRPDVELDGKSFAPALHGQPEPRGPVFWHYPQYGNQGSRPGSAILIDNWKLIHWIEDDYMELFDLGVDPSETKDLSNDQPERVASMRKQLDEWRTATKASWPTPNPNYDPNKPDGRR